MIIMTFIIVSALLLGWVAHLTTSAWWRTRIGKSAHELEMLKLRDEIDGRVHARYLELEASGKIPSDLELQVQIATANAREREAAIKVEQERSRSAQLAREQEFRRNRHRD